MITKSTAKSTKSTVKSEYTMVLNHVYSGYNSKGDKALLWMPYLSKDGELRHLGRLHVEGKASGFFKGGVSYWVKNGVEYTGKSNYKLDFVINFPVDRAEKLYQEVKEAVPTTSSEEVFKSYVQLHIRIKDVADGWQQMKEKEGNIKIAWENILEINIVSAEMPEYIKWEEEVVAAFKGGDFISEVFKPNKATNPRLVLLHEIIDYANSQFVGTSTYKKMSAKSVVNTAEEAASSIDVNLELDVLD